VFGPIVAVLVLLAKAIRKLRPRPIDVRWRRDPPLGGDPPVGGEPAGDREPRRPLTPTRSGALGLALPATARVEDDEAQPRRAEPGPGPETGARRLAG
jgi:hypothetical protein